MTDILDRVIAPSDDTFAQDVADETVLLQLKRGAYYGMDSLATRIWNGIRDGRPVREICAEIASEHSVPVETVEADARAFLEDCVANDIIILR